MIAGEAQVVLESRKMQRWTGLRMPGPAGSLGLPRGRGSLGEAGAKARCMTLAGLCSAVSGPEAGLFSIRKLRVLGWWSDQRLAALS